MSNETLTELRDVLAFSLAQLKKCEGAFKGFRVFRKNPQGLAFSAGQLRQAAVALRDHTEHLVSIADELHTTYGDITEPADLLDPEGSLEEQQRRNGVSL